MITKMAEGSATIVRRNLPGTKTCNYSKWPEESFDEMDSTLAVQQYIQQTIRKDPQGKNSRFVFASCRVLHFTEEMNNAFHSITN